MKTSFNWAAFGFILLALVGAARADDPRPKPPTSADKVEAFLRVEARKLIQAAAGKSLEAAAKQHGMSSEAFVEFNVMQFRNFFPTCFTTDEKAAAALLAKGPNDEQNKALAEKAVEALSEFGVKLPDAAMAALNRFPTAKGWALEFDRRILEAVAANAIAKAKKAEAPAPGR